MLQKIFGGKRKEQESVAPPVIKRREEDLPPEVRFAMKTGHVYRPYPADKSEADVQNTPCSSCGDKRFDGPTQTHCPSCGTARSAYMVDVTDEPFHTLPPATPGEQREIPAESMIPTIGGQNIQLGREARSYREQGDRVIIGAESVVKLIAGNHVEVGPLSHVESVVGKDKVIIYHGVDCANGVTSKEISIGDDCSLGRIVVPENGRLSIGNRSTVGIIWLGKGACLIGNPHNLKVSYLLTLDKDCAIFLGHDCEINTIESNEPIKITAGERYQNTHHKALAMEYNLPSLIDKIVRESLGNSS